MSEDEKLLKEAKKLQWEDRLSHKNWKVRNDANIDLASLLETIKDPKDPRLREFDIETMNGVSNIVFDDVKPNWSSKPADKSSYVDFTLADGVLNQQLGYFKANLMGGENTSSRLLDI